MKIITDIKELEGGKKQIKVTVEGQFCGKYEMLSKVGLLEMQVVDTGQELISILMVYAELFRGMGQDLTETKAIYEMEKAGGNNGESENS